VGELEIVSLDLKPASCSYEKAPALALEVSFGEEVSHNNKTKNRTV
jgi:hypothetical protein